MRNLLIILNFLFACQLYADEDVILNRDLVVYFKEELPNYEAVYFDFNGDGIKDVFVYANDRNWCGSGGCTSFVFIGSKNGFIFQSKITITRTHILVSSNRTNGWYDLIVNTGGVGQVVLIFDGQKYPLNPSMQPKATKNQLNSANLILN